MAQGTDAIVNAKPKSYTGGFYLADRGVTMPVPGPTAFAALDPGFDPMGYVGVNGFTKNREASDEDEQAWGGVTVASWRSDFAVSYETELLETANPVTLRRIFGEANVIEDTVNGVLTVLDNADVAPRQSGVFEMLDNNGRGHRECFENGQVLSQGEQSFSHGTSVKIPVTIKAYPSDVLINGKQANAYNMKEIDPAADAGA